MDFCGGVVGEAPGASGAASQKIPGLEVERGEAHPGLAADEKSRNGIRAGLAKNLDDPMQFAAYAAMTPASTRSPVPCSPSTRAPAPLGTARHDVFDAIGTRMNADTRWKLTEQTDNPRTATWHRTTAAGADVVFMLFNVGVDDLQPRNRRLHRPPGPTPRRPLVKLGGGYLRQGCPQWHRDERR